MMISGRPSPTALRDGRIPRSACPLAPHLSDALLSPTAPTAAFAPPPAALPAPVHAHAAHATPHAASPHAAPALAGTRTPRPTAARPTTAGTSR
eukprot:880739-Prymnesium_polylepis.1